MEELVSLLHNVAINSETLDQLNCGAKGDGKFSVIAAFKLLGSRNTQTTYLQQILWSMFLGLIGNKWVLPQNIEYQGCIDKLELLEVESTIKRIWKMIPAAIFGVFGTKGIEDALMEYQLPTNLEKLIASCICIVGFILSHLDSPDSFLNFVSSLALD
ncbi:hypothetical protein H5410_002434 [Solanum commersonii]|uniref:Uncharacterized protein n=1 Tax=Solanum commersonii TaxID=4109 RepID=A0A9J6B1R7_SOLCO|nr:hypothetical protein H5410_002434 [Solanum commersonii]